MVVREIALTTGRFDKIDFLDDNNAVAIDSTNNISKWVSEYKIAIVAIGKADVREKYLTLLKQCGYELATIIHPDAYISPSAMIGSGCVIEPKAVIYTDVRIGDGCFISAGAVVNHNSVVEDTCHINCGAYHQVLLCLKALKLITDWFLLERSRVWIREKSKDL